MMLALTSDWGTLGCADRFWWWSVEALVIGQTWPGLVMSKEGWEGGRMVLVVPTTGQTVAAVAILVVVVVVLVCGWL